MKGPCFFNSGSSGLGDYRMNISRMMILTLILGLFGQIYAYAEQLYASE